MLQLLGHFHPVIVHLPIGILLLACLFLWQSRKDRFVHLQPSVNVILLIGMISAILSCITGFVLFQAGDYDEDAVNLHQWMGIGVALISVALYYFRRKTSLQKWQLPLALLLVTLIFITGHLGGSITHGSDYLTKPMEDIFSNDSTVSFKRNPVTNVQEAVVYTDVIAPIFHEKCYSCHGAAKQKGKLRLDDTVAMMKGGKDGIVIVPRKADNSELVKRILLPREEEHHMAPKEKPQLTEQEIGLIKWWIDNGAGFSDKVKQFAQPEKIKTALLSLQTVNEEKKIDMDVPKKNVEAADEAVLQKIRGKGIVIEPVSQNSNYLSANFVTANISNQDILLLLPVKNQLIWLNLNNKNITDSALSVLSQCTALTKLQLSNTNITDAGLSYLKTLGNLRSLSLVGTKITVSGIMQLKDLKDLQSIYLFRTGINKTGWDEIKKAFPKASIDSGGYRVPYFADDTTLVKPAPVKK
ncbi:MAG TPA: c-type cytochrome domain-containing protein [Puia sp.]|nr:c-type cytochrome domain-containing protein [Puia sp.]